MIRPNRGILQGGTLRPADPLTAVLLVLVLVSSSGFFAYFTLWRTFFAADFDVNDFKAYYTGALALSEGRADLLYPDPATLNLGVLPDQPWVRFAIERGVPHPSAYIYPPFLAVVSRPLAAIPYHRANQIWFLLNTGLFAASVLLLVTWRPGTIPAEAAAGIVFTALNFYPTYRALQCGQVGLIILFLTAAALWALERNLDGVAGAAVAVAAAIKLTPAILIVFFLLARRYRAAAWALGSGIVLLGISVAGAGWGNHVIFLRDFLPALSRGAATFANQSLTGFLARIGTGVTMNAFEFLDEPAWLRIASRTAAAALLLGSLALARGIASRAGGTAPAFGLIVVASLLGSPISWEHHFVVALVPIAALLVDLLDGERAERWRSLALAAGYVLLATNAYDLIRHHFPYGLGRVAISYAFCGAAILWLLLATHAGRTAHARREAIP